MLIEWDNAKRSENLAKHGVDFAAFEGFLWNAALTRRDSHSKHDVERFVSISLIGSRHYVAVWALHDEATELISLRKADKREVRYYAQY